MVGLSMLFQIQFPPPHTNVVIMPSVEKPWYSEADFWVAIGTILLASITAWLAYETRTLRRDGAKGVRAAIKSARSAEANATYVRQTMLNTLRAYVVVKEIENTQIDEYSIPISVTVRLTNTGQTPSQHQYCFCSLNVLKEPPEKSEFEGQTAPHNIRDVLGVNQFREVKRDILRDQQEQADIMAETKFLVLHGVVVYQDMFSPNQPHRTAFCQVWDYRYREWVPKGALNYIV